MSTLRDLIPSPSALFAFEAAARLGSFTRAAEELGLTQAAVSHHVRRLEEDLCTLLFERLHRGVRLTENGKRLYNDVSIGFWHISHSAQDLRRMHRGAHVTLSASTAFATFWVLPRLVRIKQACPGIDLRIQTTERDVDLVAEGISLGIRRGRGDWDRYDAAVLEEERIYPVCSPGYLATAGAPGDVAELARHRLVHLEEPYRPCPTWVDWFQGQDVAFKDDGAGLRLNDYALVIQAALAGEGVILGWAHYMEPLIESGALVRLLDAEYVSGQAFHLVWPHGSELRPEVARVRDQLLAEKGHSGRLFEEVSGG